MSCVNFSGVIWFMQGFLDVMFLLKSTSMGGILDFVGLVRRYFRTWGIVVVVEYVVGCGHFS